MDEGRWEGVPEGVVGFLTGAVGRSSLHRVGKVYLKRFVAVPVAIAMGAAPADGDSWCDGLLY